MDCIICGGNDIKVQGNPRYESQIGHSSRNQSFKIVSCALCGFTFVKPCIHEVDRDVQASYDSRYFEAHQTAFWKKKRHGHRDERLRRMEKFSEISISTFLDVGCGEGDMLNSAQERYPLVYGQDIFDNVSMESRIQKDHIYIGSLKSAGYKDGMFDAIYVDSVLEHVVNPAEFLLVIKRILCQGGCLYVAVPNEFSLDNFVRSIIFSMFKPGVSPKIEPFRKPYHIIGFSKKSLRLLAEKCGLKVKYLRTFGGTYEFRKYSIKSFAFWVTLAFWPLYALGGLFNNAYYIEAYLTKD